MVELALQSLVILLCAREILTVVSADNTRAASFQPDRALKRS